MQRQCLSLDGEERFGRTTPIWRVRSIWTAAIASTAFLASCSDQIGQKALVHPRDAASAVVTLPNEVDLIDGPTVVDINGGLWNRAQNFKVGTGLLNPFLTIQNDGSEEGFNTDAATLPLDDKRQEFTNALPLNHIPVINKKGGGGAYREIIFDANEANSDPDAQYSIDQFDLWLCNDAAAGTFSTRSQFQTNANCTKVYDLGGKVGLATDANSKGSGSDFDYQILIPDSKFIAAATAVGVNTATDCTYNGADADPCGSYIILDLKLGFKGGTYVTGSTFEEMSTIKRPWVSVTKTAVPSFTRRYNWHITKSVSPTDITLFDGQSQDATWSIVVSPGTPPFTDSNGQLTGTVTISNNSGDPVSILSITDQIDGAGNVSLTCPNGTGPVTLANKATYVCTYSTSATVTPGAHTNVATVGVDAGSDVDPSTFKGSAQFNFANATPTEIDKNPNVYDKYQAEAEVLKGTASQGTFTYKKTYTCSADQGSYSNIARVDITNPPDDPTATATLNVHCLSLTVTKTAATTVNRTFKWLISKTVTPTSWNLFNGDKGTSDYTVTATPNGFDDTGLAVSGDITIHNPNSVSVFLQSLPTDNIANTGSATVTCPKVGTTTSFPFTLTAGSDLVCSYTRSLPSGFTSQVNTATVSAKPTSTGTAKDFSGTATVNAATATPTETNKVVHVTDNYNATGAVALGTATWGTGTTPGAATVLHPISRDYPCPGAGTFTNIATITETAQTASATVTVTCRDYTVTKTAPTKYRRKWPWSVDKTINPTSTNLLLDINQQYIVDYTVAYTRGAATEDNFRITGGTIKVSNPAGSGVTSTAIINSVADAVSGIVNPAAVDCGAAVFPYSLAAGADLNCTYADVALPDKTTRTNTATAKRQNRAFSSALVASSIAGTTDRTGTASVTFASAPSEALDECASFSDSNPGTTVAGRNCGSKTFTYSKTLQYASCGLFTVPNTASFTSTAGTTGTSSNTATPLTGSKTVTINVSIACPQGCTLTQGYWKTHNVSFKGGAPADDNWNNLPAKEGTGFFTLTGPTFATAGPNAEPFSWFTVFWTAVQGNQYYNLAHQYEGAKLNYLNNAGQTSTVTATIASAEAFFAAAGNTPTGWATNGLTPTTKNQLTTWAGILGAYNEGKAPGGPQHCSEDNTSSSAP